MKLFLRSVYEDENKDYTIKDHYRLKAYLRKQRKLCECEQSFYYNQFCRIGKQINFYITDYDKYEFC